MLWQEIARIYSCKSWIYLSETPAYTKETGQGSVAGSRAVYHRIDTENGRIPLSGTVSVIEKCFRGGTSIPSLRYAQGLGNIGDILMST
jgi:hypothetical protein